MNIELTKATLSEKPVLANLLELYLHDFTEYDGADVGPDGRFGYDFLDAYWTEAARTPLVARVDGNLAGFALLKRGSTLLNDPDIMHVSEFFIMRKYRRRGAGSETARRMFDLFPGRWEVSEMAANLPAQAFWRKVIGAYTSGRFEERQWDNARWRGPVQWFDNNRP
jgi:predicted acetyltransferase